TVPLLLVTTMNPSATIGEVNSPGGITDSQSTVPSATETAITEPFTSAAITASPSITGVAVISTGRGRDHRVAPVSISSATSPASRFAMTTISSPIMGSADGGAPTGMTHDRLSGTSYEGGVACHVPVRAESPRATTYLAVFGSGDAFGVA